MKTKNIMIVGVGGQGTLLTSRILGGLAMDAGYDVKLSEVHGMAQRGGSVVTFVRYGDQVAEPIVEEGLADVICDGENSDLKLIFSAEPNHVKVRRWPLDTAKEQNSYGQRVRVTLDGNTAYIKRAKKTYIYEVIATWDNGNVHYGFYIP